MSAEAASLLRERARSYSRDAVIFRAEDDKAMAAAYQAIANELRKVADEVE